MNKIVYGLRERDRGQVLVQVALSLVAFALLAGLATDVGQMYGQRRQMQQAANAGALAGARELCLGNNQTQASAIAQDSAQPAVANSQVQAVVDGDKMIVTTTASVKSVFSRFIGIGSTNISAIAQASCATEDCKAALVASNIEAD